MTRRSITSPPARGRASEPRPCVGSSGRADLAFRHPCVAPRSFADRTPPPSNRSSSGLTASHSAIAPRAGDTVRHSGPCDDHRSRRSVRITTDPACFDSTSSNPHREPDGGARRPLPSPGRRHSEQKDFSTHRFVDTERRPQVHQSRLSAEPRPSRARIASSVFFTTRTPHEHRSTGCDAPRPCVHATLPYISRDATCPPDVFESCFSPRTAMRSV
jgi:hypothetical protein